MVARTVTASPDGFAANGQKFAGWWHAVGDRVVCDLCPRGCSLRDGDFGFCFVRENHGGQMVLNTYGHSTGFCVDPAIGARTACQSIRHPSCERFGQLRNPRHTGVLARLPRHDE